MTNTSSPRILGGNTGRSGMIAAVIVMVVTHLTPGVSSAAVDAPGGPGVPGARVPPVQLGDARDCAVMGGSSVIGLDKITVTGDLNVSPGAFVSGFPPGQVRGSIDLDNAEARREKAAAVAAYHDAAGRPPTATVPPVLGNDATMTPGVYNTPGGAFTLSGTLHLDGGADPNAVFIFQATSLLTERVSNIDLVNGAQAENVFWQVGDAATLGRYSTFRGNLLARRAVAVAMGTAMYGRAIALDQAVTVEGTTTGPATRLTTPDNPPTTTTLTSSPNPSRLHEPVTFTATVNGNVGSFLPTGLVRFKDGGTVIGSAPLDTSAVARFTTAALTRGVHQMTAVYVDGGTAVNEQWVHFAPSESPVVQHQVLNRG